jgi:hypothetical protein
VVHVRSKGQQGRKGISANGPEGRLTSRALFLALIHTMGQVRDPLQERARHSARRMETEWLLCQTTDDSWGARRIRCSDGGASNVICPLQRTYLNSDANTKRSNAQ